MNLFNDTAIIHLEMVKMINFAMYILPRLKETLKNKSTGTR